MARVLLVDDHEVVREGLRAVIARRPGFEVVGAVGTVAEALTEAERLRPDIIVMDVRLPDGSGIKACRDVRSVLPETRVVMLTSYADEQAVLAAIMAGASGYVLKGTATSELLSAIEAASNGHSLLDPAVTEAVLAQVRRAAQMAPDPLAALNDQERRILELIAEGKTNREIAAEVFLSDKTVKNYVSSILSKLELHRRSEAAAFLARQQTQRPLLP